MSTEEPDNYLAVLKASYDYEPQSEDEIAIKEDQLLLLVEKVDEDWWKVKIKGSSQETESPTGLIPAAYVEQAEHTSIVKALYDYEATAPGELSVHEDDVLLVFETEEDWILVQVKSSEGKAGYVPGNYVEVIDTEEPSEPAAPSRIVVPDSPPKPAYVDPADRVASTKLTADDIKTWSVSEIDKKGKKKKGTLGIGNGAVFFASESDKTPVQKWQTKDVKSISSEKAKHVEIEIGGPNPASLHFHAGSKDNAEAIIGKLASSRALTSPPDDEEPTTPTTKIAAKKPSVHFSPAAPTIIPDPEEEDEPEPEPELEPEPEPEELQSTQDSTNTATALYDFTADGEDELSVKEGEKLTVLEGDDAEWWKCRNSTGREGVVPASYLEAGPSGSGVNGHKVEDDDEDEDARLAEEHRRQQEEEERRQEEAEEAERRKKEEATKARKAEAQRKAKEAAEAAEAERKARQKKKEVAAARAASPPAHRQTSRPEPPRSSSSREDSRQSSDVTRPPADQTRVWHDRSGQFRVEAAFLGFKDGKLRLHKVNGVIVEVPSEKMSVEDLRYVEKAMEKKRPSGPSHVVSDDDIPLALAKNGAHKGHPPQKKAPKIDWFDFFLSAGCDLDDCTRYAASFERDKMDESLLADITDSTMRSLGLREGDILRVKKAIEKRRPTENLNKPSPYLQEQVKRDEELARQLQAQENSGRGSAPNLFSAGPGGVLKQRRGRPQPSKTLPATVDLNAISSGSIAHAESPRPSSAQLPTSASSPPARPSSAGASTTINGFEDDAWTNRPSSTKPIKAASPPPARTAPAPQAPAASAQPAPPVTTAPSPPKTGTPNLASTTEDDIMKQLERLTELRKNSTPSQQPQPAPSPSIITPPVGFQSGLGMGSSPSPIGQFATARMVSPPPAQQPYNGPRGPFAPVPANQGLLQPLVPTQTGFGGFIPTKANSSPSPFQNQLAHPGFMQAQPTGFQNPSPVMMQPTGAYGGGPFAGGVPAFQGQPGNFGSMGSMSSLPVQPQATGFPMMNQMNASPFGNPGGMASPPPLPTNQVKDNSPANVFAQMKSGTFGNDDNQNNGPTGWGQQQQYSGFTGY